MSGARATSQNYAWHARRSLRKTRFTGWERQEAEGARFARQRTGVWLFATQSFFRCGLIAAQTCLSGSSHSRTFPVFGVPIPLRVSRTSALSPIGEILSTALVALSWRRKLRAFLQFLAAKVPFLPPADCSLDKPLLHRQPSLPVRLQLLLDRHVLLAHLKDSGRLLPPLDQSVCSDIATRICSRATRGITSKTPSGIPSSPNT